MVMNLYMHVNKNEVGKMKGTIIQSKSLVSETFLKSLILLSIFCLILLSLQFSSPSPRCHPRNDLKIRSRYTSYDTYIHHQLQKTTNPKLRKIWTSRDWDRKILVFTHFFNHLKQEKLLINSSKCLCVGARVGQEVEALKRVGVNDSIGLDLVPYPPNVIKGDFHHQPFDDNTFDYEFSNVFDHALYPDKFVKEIQRTLKPGGICVLHVALSRRSDKYSANDLYSIEPLKQLFNGSDLVRSRKVDGFGLDTEVVFRKRQKGHLQH